MEKRKRKHKRNICPPLTFLDKAIYFILMVISFLLVLLVFFCIDDLQNLIAFSDGNAVAYKSNASTLFAVPFLFYFEISALTYFICALEDKKPIFGSKKYKYGEYPFSEDCYPVFGEKKYNRYIRPSRKKYIRSCIIIWCTVLVILGLLVPFSLFGREVLCKDNRIEKRNSLNFVSETYTAEDYEHLTISAHYVSGYRTSGGWKYEITIKTTDGEKYTFDNRDFDWRANNSRTVSLEKMLEIKNLFSKEAITIKGSENIDDVSEFYGMTEVQQEKLVKLFS